VLWSLFWPAVAERGRGDAVAASMCKGGRVVRLYPFQHAVEASGVVGAGSARLLHQGGVLSTITFRLGALRIHLYSRPVVEARERRMAMIVSLQK
jgi:hypothetical protein